MTKNNSNWEDIKEKFKKEYASLRISETISRGDEERILAFFKPYFQALLHDKAVEELEK